MNEDKKEYSAIEKANMLAASEMTTLKDVVNQRKKKYDYIIYIGRFQPPHLAHIQTIKKASKLARGVLVLAGSANQPRTIKNPWSHQEREEMILSSLPDDIRAHVSVLPLHDKMYNDQEWVKQVQNIISGYDGADGKKPKIGIIGFAKDDSSYYLKMFPQWEFIDVGNIEDIHASDIRELYFDKDSDYDFETKIGRNLPVGIHDYLKAFQLTEDYEKLTAEFSFIEKYKAAWALAPYAPIFVTVDAVVVQSGHVLLVRRRAEPGKGLYAMPGGFLNNDEKIEDAVIRELREETKIKVPEPVLRGSIKAKEVYDKPDRSLRGRTITHASLIELQPGELPKVKGGDDAEKAKWVPISVFEKMEGQMFEDHFYIIKSMINLL